MRAVLVFLAGLLLGACARPQTIIVEAPNTVAAAEDLTSKTVALVEPMDGDLRVFCTGVWVSPTTILTANHCVDDVVPNLEPVGYTTRGDMLDAAGAVIKPATLRNAMLVARDTDHDLALLRAFAPPLHLAAPLDDAPIAAGQHVQVMGHPLGLLFSYSEGTIAAVRRVELNAYADGSTWIQTTAPISPGNSGGGLFDMNGHLIGITTATFTKGQNLNIFIHRAHIAAFLKTAVL